MTTPRPAARRRQAKLLTFNGLQKATFCDAKGGLLACD